jgi:hypothetical protein
MKNDGNKWDAKNYCLSVELSKFMGY